MNIEEIENGLKITVKQREKNIIDLVDESRNIIEDNHKIMFTATGNGEGHISKSSKTEILIILFKLFETRNVMSIDIKYN